METIKNVIGDWGLGIGECPIPNTQSPITNIINDILC